MRRGVVAVCVLFIFGVAAVALPARAAAAPASQKLAKARAEFERGDYKRVIDVLEPELYPRPTLRDEEELKDAHYLLGVSFYYVRKQDRARQEFTALLYLDPERTLDPATESPEVYAFFEGVKGELRKRLDDLLRQKEKDALANRPPAMQVIIERTIREPSPWSNFVPLGYGQFRNGQKAKGVFFLASETLVGGASLALFTYQAVTYGIPARYDPSSTDADTLKLLQIAQITTGAAFLVLYGWQVIDAFANQKPLVETKRTEVPIKRSSLDVLPIVSPGTVGAAWVWRF